MFKYLKFNSLVLNKNFKNNERIILRDFLAMERTTLANERTLFAYIRSSIYLSISAFAVLELKILADIQWISYLSITISVILLVFGIARYFTLRNKLQTFYNDVLIEDLEKKE